MIEDGYIHDVRLVTLGSFLDGEHLTGATTLKVMDAADFNEEGGSFILDDQTLDYVSADIETDTLELVSPLAADYEDSVPLYINPLTREKQAVVVLDGYDEALTAVVPHSLYDRLPDGIREEFNRESVTIELENSTWKVKDVYGKEPVIDGSYLENVVADDVLDGIITEVKLANEAVTAAKVAVGAIKPIALTESLNDAIMQRWTDSMEDASAWQTLDALTGASWSLVNESEAPSGGKVGQFSGRVAIRGTAPILFDPNSLYRVSARVRCKTQSAAGASTFYCGLLGLAEDKTTYVNRNGSVSYTSQFYMAASNKSLPAADGWVTVTGYVKGRSASPSGGQALDMQSPTTLHDNVRYVVPMFWMNYAVTDLDGIQQIDSVTVEVLRTGVVTANELAANSVVAGKVATNAIQAGNVAAGAIQTDNLAANAVTTAKLAALSVTANELAANAVTASKILAGEVTAEKLDVNALIGKTAQSANFVNDPEQGITGWSFQADGSAYLRSATIGNDLFSISPTGDAAFQSLSVSSISVNGDDLAGSLDSRPRGVLNVYPLTGALSYAAINTEYLVIRFSIPNVESRMYKISLDNFRFDRGSGTPPSQFQVNVYSDYLGGASTVDYLLHSFWRGAGASSATDDLWSASHYFSPPDEHLGKDLSIAVYTSVGGSVASAPRLECTDNTRVVVEDVGGKVVYAPVFDITNSTVPAKTTYTKEYSSAWMSTWGTNSGRRTDGKAYQGNFSSTNGNNYTKYGFPSTIQTDLSGATVKKVELYLDNNHFYSNSGGNAIIGTHADTTQPTGSSSTSGTYGRQSIAFTYGQAKWVTLSSVFGTDLKSGAAKGITLGRTSGGTLAEYAYFASSAKLRITYEK